MQRRVEMNVSKDEIAFVTIKIENGNVSFDGSSTNQGGQMQDILKPRNKYEKALIAMWNRWHLNDMHAGCIHQRKLWNLDRKETVTEYAPTMKLYSRQEKLEKLIKEKLIRGGIVYLGPLSRTLLSLRWCNDITILTIPEYFRKQYKVHKQEKKPVCHISQKEHPEGLLCKPCPVCGYKYGTDWLKEELPSKIEVAIEYLVNKINEMRKEKNK